ncbi:cupin-like domain-containing protein [Sphingomonas sp. LB-2]|uniref:cupin-like domain-containing protein n=1 Tax=Sphingomonas caeni TaxID=2984949 RepID=UPI00222EE6BF|nr:cupin-like domain-containing protein [Sphingomonas caeni]MCW3847418.1 cupin-like domain-containing protein [Sphingomonas caeni]
MTQLPDPRPIREFTNVDRRMFEDEIRPLQQPAILRGLGADWPSVKAGMQSDEAGIDYLMSLAPPREVTVLIGAPEIEGRFFYAPDLKGMNFTRAAAPLAAFFGRLLGDRTAEAPFSLAVQGENIPQLLPGFVEANDTGLLDRSVQPRIWIGNTIRVAPHFDLMENIGMVVLGRRRFTVFPPDQLPNLYIGPIEVTPAGTPVSLVDLAHPDLERFPLYAEAAKHAQSAVLEPGDAIYLPFHWWHAVDSLEKVNAFVNYWWNPAQAGLGRPYDALMHALWAFRGIPDEQREVWRMVFDNFVFSADPVPHLEGDTKGVLGPPTPEMLARMKATLKQIVAGL